MLTRRDAVALSTAAETQPGSHALQPLPFDPKTLDGLSEELIASHHENNFANGSWDEVNRRFERARKKASAIFRAT